MRGGLVVVAGASLVFAAEVSLAQDYRTIGEVYRTIPINSVVSDSLNAKTVYGIDEDIWCYVAERPTPTRTPSPTYAGPAQTGQPFYYRSPALINDRFYLAWTFPSLYDVGVWKIDCIPYKPSWPHPQINTLFVITVTNGPPTATIFIDRKPEVGATIAGEARNVKDPAKGNVTFTWEFTKTPGAHRTIDRLSGNRGDDLGHHDINFWVTLGGGKGVPGDWTLTLYLDSDRGERGKVDWPFHIDHTKPTYYSIGMTTVEVDATQPLDLIVTAYDPDGDDVTITWSVTSKPARAALPPDQTGQVFHVPTGPTDIGTWTIVPRMVDTVGLVADNAPTYHVTVRPLRPKIRLVGRSHIRVGDPLRVETIETLDPYGAPLEGTWTIVQSPQSSPASDRYGATRSGLAFDLPTGAQHAGTWILKLTVTDSAGTTAEDRHKVLVDMPPSSKIADLGSADAHRLPLVLDGSPSEDPDSPCPDRADRCHDTLEPPVEVSGGIATYAWSVTAVPPELLGEYATGPVEEVFFIAGDRATLKLDEDLVPPGDWKFELEVIDQEGNEDFSEVMVTVVPASSDPNAIISGPARYTTDAGGSVAEAVRIDGSESYDPDNLFFADREPGLGITDYRWAVEPPEGCSPPALGDESVLTLFAANEVVPPSCHGEWIVRLTVTDDDQPSRDADEETRLVIGNCADTICIDAPTEARPQIFDLVEKTRVEVIYHVDSALYGDPAFANGIYPKLEILPHGEETPVYSTIDPYIVPDTKGHLLLFGWDGHAATGRLVDNGYYDVRVSLFDHEVEQPRATAIEPNAIHIAVVEISVTSPEPLYVDQDAVAAGCTDLRYAIKGAASLEEVAWRIRHPSGFVVHESIEGPEPIGSACWDSTSATPGKYTFEVEAYEDGRSVAKSEPFAFTLYRFRLAPVGGGQAVFAYVDNNDDDRDEIPDLEEIGFDPDLVAFELSLEPAIAGTLLLGEDPRPHRLWASADRSVPMPATARLPEATLPREIFLEAIAPTRSNLSAKVTTDDGAVLETKPVSLHFVAVEIMEDSDDDRAITGTDRQLFALHLARWDNAYDADSNLLGDFISRDPRRFHVRVRDPNSSGEVRAWISTRSLFELPLDGPTEESLRETGTGSGVFVSEAQILTMGSTEPDPDDRYAAFSAIAGGTVPDGARDDRTQQGDIDGDLQAFVWVDGAEEARLITVPICSRIQRERRRMKLRVHVFEDPFQDIGYLRGGVTIKAGNGVFDYEDLDANGRMDLGEPSEPYRDFQEVGRMPEAYPWRRGDDSATRHPYGPVVPPTTLRYELLKADNLWQTACIKTDYDLIVEPAPLVDFDPRKGSILDDAEIDPNDAGNLETHYEEQFSEDLVHVVYTAPRLWIDRNGAYDVDGLAIGPGAGTGVNPKRLMILLRTSRDANAQMILAHELGHLLTNQGDEPNPKQIIFPQDFTTFGGPEPEAINIERRISAATEAFARTSRSPAVGDAGQPGNTFLRPY